MRTGPTFDSNELEDSVGGCWDLGRFLDSVLKASGRVAKHSRRLIVHLAPAGVGSWQRLLGRITSWRLRPRFPLPGVYKDIEDVMREQGEN